MAHGKGAALCGEEACRAAGSHACMGICQACFAASPGTLSLPAGLHPYKLQGQQLDTLTLREYPSTRSWLPQAHAFSLICQYFFICNREFSKCQTDISPFEQFGHNQEPTVDATGI